MHTASFSEQLSPLEWGPLSNARFIDLLAQFSNSKIAILVDENTHDHCLEFLITGFEALAEAEVIMLPAGEENKVLEVCFQVWETLTEAGFGRHDLLINLGGGMVTDLGGFVASVYKRGFAFVHIPTSLLGMVDAAVGGKTGIDLAGYKNQLGTFQEPLATFVDTGFLQTLPDTEWRNGFAELLKHALIADKTLWEALTQIKNIPLELTADQIRRGVEIKREIVFQDPIESGLRKTLNFGHTIGHALESYYLHSDIPLAHGHAVAIGMLLEAQLSVYQANLSQTEFAAIEKCIKQTYPIQIPNDAEALWTLMQQDKKNANGEVRCCLLNAIGTCVFDQTLTFQAFEHVMAQFNS
jgi:3-dehydroquinate synthase